MFHKLFTMKKSFLLLLCLISMFVFSQEYHFDHFIREQSKRIKPDKQEWISESFYDSVNNKKLVLITQNNKTIATIYEKENRIRHVFKVNKSNGNLTFAYKYSNQFPEQKTKDYDKENVIKVEKIDSLYYNIIVFKNARLKRKKISGIVKIEKSQFDYVNFSADYSRTDEINEKIKSFLNPKFKYIVSSQQTKYYTSGYAFEESTQKIEKTDLNIMVPEKLVLKEYNYWSDFEE
ncbi:hypothetical protein SAMN05421682_106121 [Chryseobacterium indoltheticum]|uniref:Uncharacterized protein n=2 Tax=Chryseobacterium indoltheticum TaxID=254 RepID=A0A381F4N5_9FLAO|nr:hypothetical protein SAMN05421682_106121 [Chryseobacterium indoltheticum]SUX41521.1 Uncharacterised protein [Chryseobacterium indoltheticum]